MNNQLKNELAKAISKATSLNSDEIVALLEKPKNRDFGDLALPCFPLSKAWKISPVECAKKLNEELSLPDGFLKADPTGPFLNFTFDRKTFVAQSIQEVFSKGQEIGKTNNQDKTIVIEYSSPNIAKPFHVGHLRTTLIGHCLDQVYRYLGYNTISVNHIGDWGTQFGFVWAGCELLGKPTGDVTVSKLVELYKRATTLKENQENESVPAEDKDLPNIDEMARGYFIDLENNKSYAVDFWKWCLDISLKYLKDTYLRLSISFDHYTGESFYSDKLDDVQKDLKKAKVLTESQGAFGVDLGEDLGFARILTPDGRSLYLTRDIAAAKYRFNEYKFDDAVYIVGAPQTLHFQQLNAILEKLGSDYPKKLTHVPFGHVLGMKTRGEGTAIELNSFLDEAHQRALSAYREQVSKRPEGLDENEVAEGVAIGAIIFSTLIRTPIKDVNFSWKHALEFQGDTGPYVLYALARINGIKEKASNEGLSPSKSGNSDSYSEENAFFLAELLSDFDETLTKTIEFNEPDRLASYALALAKTVSKAYLDLKVVGEEKKLAEDRLALFEATRIVLEKAITLLGMTPLQRM